MALIDSTIIIADDLTGANDTALQFFKKGSSAKIIIEVYKNQLITFAKRQTFHICGANISPAIRISPTVR